MGDPGYKFKDELPQAGEYKLGSVAMANSGPNTNGSQFFIVSGENGVKLPPLYSLFAEVTTGMDVVESIQTSPTGDNNRPIEDIFITKIEVTEGK
jgi:cyclophilin family peptidyl-prolyl cis-trans isomerase